MTWLARGLAWWIAWWVGGVLAVRRKHVLSSLKRAGIPDARRVATRMYGLLGEGLVELLSLSLGRARAPSVRIDAALASLLAERTRAGAPGCIIATAHTGNWDSAACGVAVHTPLAIVSKRLSIGRLDRMWQGIRARAGIELLFSGQAARQMGAVLRRGVAVAMLVDQAPARARGAIALPFLGSVAWVELAPALMAMRHRVPLVIAFARRCENVHDIVCPAVIEPPRIASRRWAVDAMTQATSELEHFVRRHPDQWLWMHRRWKVPAGAAVAGGDRAGALDVAESASC